MNTYAHQLKKYCSHAEIFHFLLRSLMKMRINCAILPKPIFQREHILFTSKFYCVLIKSAGSLKKKNQLKRLSWRMSM